VEKYANKRCLSVRLSACHKSVFYQNGWTDRAGFFCVEASFDIFYTVLQGSFRISKNNGTSLWNVCPEDFGFTLLHGTIASHDFVQALAPVGLLLGPLRDAMHTSDVYRPSLLLLTEDSRGHRRLGFKMHRRTF